MNHPTRFCLSLLLAGGMTATLPAQDTPPPPPAEPAEIVARSDEELDDLLGPIALYPDDLIALILPATAEPTGIVLAARYHEHDGAMDEIDKQPWDESVRAIARFPDVVEWMSNNLAWTQDVGDAFLIQPAEVMKSIQRLRAKAYAAGTLRDSEHQKVLVDGQVIRIVSAEADVIYVPRYRTEVVYVDRPVYYSEPWITFGIGWRVGSWHRWSCDWYSHRIWIFDHHDQWRARHWHHRHRTHIHFSWHYRDHGRAWAPHRSHVRYHHLRRDWDRDHRRDRDRDRNRRVHRPSPYVENESRHRERERNRDIARDRVDRERREGFTGDRRNQERRDNNITNADRNERRNRSPQNGRSTSDGGTPRVVTNPHPAAATNPPPAVSDRRTRNDRTRDTTVDRGSNAGQGDRRDNSRGSRNVAPVVPSRPAVVATPASPPPAANANSTRSVQRERPSGNGAHVRIRGADSGTAGNSGSNRPPRTYANERMNTASKANATRAESSRPSASASRQNNSNSSSNARISPPPASSGRSQGGDNKGGGRSSDSGRSRDSSRSDDGDRGGRSNSNDSGRGGRGR